MLMTTFRRLLLPTDFSEGVAQASAKAAGMTKQYGAELHILHVLEPIILPPFPGESIPESFFESREAYARQQLDNWLEAERLSDLDPLVAVTQGSPYLEIVSYANDHHIDLIVMGTHGRTGISHAIIGSVAERVVRTSSCPVLVIPPMRQLQVETHD